MRSFANVSLSLFLLCQINGGLAQGLEREPYDGSDFGIDDELLNDVIPIEVFREAVELPDYDDLIWTRGIDSDMMELDIVTTRDAARGRWSAPFSWPIIPAHATLLPNGRVFSFGTNQYGEQGAHFNYSVWNPARGVGGGAHELLPNRHYTDIFCSATVLLAGSGDVLIPGGDTRNPVNAGISDTLIFRQGSQSLDRTAHMQYARWYPTATTLPNGDTLVYGGIDGGYNTVVPAEVYSNGSWRTLWGTWNESIMNGGEGKWFYPRNWVAPNGRIFGMTGNVMYFLDWGGEGASQIAGYLPNKTRSHTSTAVMYRPGEIIQLGGSTHGDTQARGSNQAIRVDIRSGWPVVEDLPDMAYSRVWANATVMANGEVLVTGGSAYENRLVEPANAAEIWNPDTRRFRTVSSAHTARLYHSVALLLPDASVLVGGGGAPGPLTNLNAEIYYPPYLFDGAGNFAARPTIGDFPQSQSYNNLVGIPHGGSGGIARVTLVRTGSVTHSFDMSQMFLDLGFSASGGRINVRMPDSPNVAPPGHYMLFFINHAGVPSHARFVSLGQGGGGAPGGGVTPGGGISPGGEYTLVSRYSGKCLDVDGGDPANGANYLQWSCHGGANQRFRVQSAGGGTYNLVNVQTGKCVDVSGPSSADGQNIHQWDCHGGSNQAVSLVPSSGGAYSIRFAHSGKCLDIDGPSGSDGANIHQWSCHGDTSQDWFFRP